MSQLRAFVERIMRIKDEIDALNADARDVYAEAKSVGYDKTVLGQVVAHLRKRDKNPEKLDEQSELFDLYLSAITNAAPNLQAVPSGGRPSGSIPGEAPHVP